MKNHFQRALLYFRSMKFRIQRIMVAILLLCGAVYGQNAAAQAVAPESVSIRERDELPWLVTVEHRINFGEIQRSLNEMGIKLNQMPARFRPVNLTTGIVIEKGYVLTRLVNINPESSSTSVGQIEVRTTSGKYPATFVGLDGPTGLCLLLVQGLEQDPVSINNLKELKAGSQAYFLNLLITPVGNLKTSIENLQRELSSSDLLVKHGQVTQLEDEIYLEVQLDDTENLLPSISTGVLLDEKHNLLGLPLLINKGVLKALYAYEARQAMDRILARRGSVPRGWLGVVGQDSTALTAEEREEYKLGDTNGIIIKHIVPGSPAQVFGLKVGDVIKGVNGKSSLTSQELSAYVSNQPAGRLMAFDIYRAGALEHITIPLGERGYSSAVLPDRVQLNANNYYFQEELKRLNSLISSYHRRLSQMKAGQADAEAVRSVEARIAEMEARRKRVSIKQQNTSQFLNFSQYLDRSLLGIVTKDLSKKMVAGVRIVQVQPDSAAFQAGIRPEDILVQFDKYTVLDRDSFFKMLNTFQKKKEEAIDLTVRRAGKLINLKLNIKNSSESQK